jgi:hypothetical protein
MMAEDRFWALVDAVRAQGGGDDETAVEALHVALARLGGAEILDFQRRLGELHERSYRADLWGAAYLLCGGCSDDGFDYFRAWRIAQGRVIFDAALADPDSLAGVPGVSAGRDDYELEAMLAVGLDAWMDRTGADMDAFYEALGDSGELPDLGDFAWDDGDGDVDAEAAARLYPRLWALIGG